MKHMGNIIILLLFFCAEAGAYPKNAVFQPCLFKTCCPHLLWFCWGIPYFCQY
jgi:hypothetical protein